MASVTRRHRGPDLTRRRESEEQILAATEQLLRDGAGFTDLGVQRIAEAAGVARSSFYVIFPDKVALLLRLVQGLKQGLLEIATQWPIDSSEDDRAALGEAYARMLSFYREHSDILAAVAEVSAYDSEVRAVWDGYLDGFVRNLAARIRSEQDAGRTSSDMDPELAARVTVWGGERLMVRHVTSRPAGEDEALAREMAASRWFSLFRRPNG